MDIKKYLPIDIKIITASKTNPRTQFPENEIAELAESITKNGQQLPIVVREIGEKKYELVDGERRLRACKFAKIETINAEVREMTDVEVLKYQLMTFLHSKNITPLDEAKSLLNLSKMGLSPEQIAGEVAKDVTHVIRYLRLLKLIPEAMKDFSTGKLPLAHALEICRLQPFDQEKAMEYTMGDFYETDQARSISDVKDYIFQQIHLDLRKISFSKTDPHLLPKAGACTMCVKRSGFNAGLFPDIQLKDTCTDPACFKEKIEAHISAEKASIKAKDLKVIEIATGYNKPKDHPQSITNRSYKEIKGKPCKYAIMGIAVDGSTIGKSIQICNNKECSQHWGVKQNSGVRSQKPEKAKTPEQVEKARIAKLKEEMQADIENKTIEQLYAILPDHIPSILNKTGYAYIVKSLMDRWYVADDVREIFKLKKNQKYDKLPPKKLISILHFAAFLNLKDGNEEEAILEAAKLWKVNIEKVRKETTEIVKLEYAEKMKPVEVQNEKGEVTSKKGSLALPEKESEEVEE
ncbi:MAG: ParB/RepB/Spo0J family partition protein [Candidatus Magasanikiibacteriota bacterium]